MLSELKGYLPNYKITIKGKYVVFNCTEDNFEATYPLGFMMELYRQNLIEQAFIMPSIIPN